MSHASENIATQLPRVFLLHGVWYMLLKVEYHSSQCVRWRASASSIRPILYFLQYFRYFFQSIRRISLSKKAFFYLQFLIIFHTNKYLKCIKYAIIRIFIFIYILYYFYILWVFLLIQKVS